MLSFYKYLLNNQYVLGPGQVPENRTEVQGLSICPVAHSEKAVKPDVHPYLCDSHGELKIGS